MAEPLGLLTSDENRLKEAKKRSEGYQEFRDALKYPFQFLPKSVSPVNIIPRVGAYFGEKIADGVGIMSDVLGNPEGSAGAAKISDQLSDFNTPKYPTPEFDVNDSEIFSSSLSATDGPQTEEYQAIKDREIASKAAKDQKLMDQQLKDEESNLKSFSGKTDIIEIDTPTDPTEDLFSSAMQDFITGARGAGPDSPAKRTLDDYKKEFSEATGIDVTGKVDKSSALMAMGLALMQNKAGKGFNVGKILGEVGKAGEVALPKLEAAKKEAKVGAAQAGKYALEMRSSDETKRAAAKEKMMARGNYYIIPKGEGISGQIANILDNKGSLESLNKYELSKLMENPKFSSKYDVLPGSTWSSIVEEAMKTPKAKENYITAGRNQNLIADLDDKAFQIRLFDPNPNTNPNGNVIMAGDGSEQYRLLARMAQDTERAKQKFIDLGALNKGTNAFRYSANSLDGVAEAFGINFVEGTNATQKMKKILTQLQAKNAPRILGEAGKTISDADRQMVKDIVGNVTIMSSEDLLAEKFTDLFNDIILGAENDIRQGLSTLNKYTGRKIGDEAYSNKALSKEKQEKLNLYMKNFMKS